MSINSSIIDHLLAGRREKRDRKRLFIGFVTYWKSRAERENSSVTANQFNSDVAALERKWALIESDYGFDLEILIERITERTAGQMEQANCHKELVLDLEKLLRALESD